MPPSDADGRRADGTTPVAEVRYPMKHTFVATMEDEPGRPEPGRQPVPQRGFAIE